MDAQLPTANSWTTTRRRYCPKQRRELGQQQLPAGRHRRSFHPFAVPEMRPSRTEGHTAAPPESACAVFVRAHHLRSTANRSPHELQGALQVALRSTASHSRSASCRCPRFALGSFTTNREAGYMHGKTGPRKYRLPEAPTESEAIATPLAIRRCSVAAAIDRGHKTLDR